MNSEAILIKILDYKSGKKDKVEVENTGKMSRVIANQFYHNIVYLCLKIKYKFKIVWVIANINSEIRWEFIKLFL